MAWVPHTPPRPSSTNIDQEWEASERQFRRGLELRPNDPNAHHWFGHLLMTLGRVDESLEIARRGYELDPLSPAMNLQWAYALFDARRYDEAVEQLRRSVEMEEDYDRFRRLEASALARLGRAAEGETVWQDVVERLGEGTLSGAGCFLAQLGQTSAAEERVRDLRAIGGDFPLSLARLESCLGNVERSLDALERAQLEGRHPGQLVVDPRFDPLRDEPRYRMVMGEWGLPQDRIFPPTR